MKKGKLKGKILTITIAIGVVTGGGIAFANSDAGEQLRAWYNGMFNQTVDNIESEVSGYTESQIPALEQELEDMKTQAGIDIDLSRELATGESLEEIVAAKLEHMGSIDAEKEAILAQIGIQFYNVFLDGYFEILALQEEGLTYATNDLTDYTSEAGEEAVNQLTTDINAARDEAVSELEDAIAEAQAELAAELDNQEQITTRNLINQVDWAIENLREEVTEVLAGLMDEQQNLIATTAEELKNDALSALDDVVSGINE